MLSKHVQRSRGVGLAQTLQQIKVVWTRHKIYILSMKKCWTFDY